MGYGGTKEEMERLINDANKLDSTILGVGETVKDMDEISFDQIIRAIHAVQTEIGITGTTASEATATIQGSIGAAKAAWDNFLSGAGDVDTFVDAFEIAADNVVKNLREIIPRISTGLGVAMDKLAPLIPDIINDLLPAVIKGITSLTKAVVQQLPKLLGTVGNALAANFGEMLKIAWVPLLAANKNFLAVFSNLGKSVKTALAGAASSIKEFGLSTSTLKSGITGVGNAASSALGGIKAWASSFGGVVTIIAAVSGAVVSLAEHIRDNDPYYQRIQKVNELAAAHEELEAAVESQISASEAEYGHLTSLKRELDNLVDANGRVTKGYEARAQFIVKELNDALGTEIAMTDGVIEAYGELSASIDHLLVQKRADAVMLAQEEAYKAAIAAVEEYRTAIDEQYAAITEAEARYAENNSIHNANVLAEAERQLGAMQENYQAELDVIANYEAEYALLLDNEYQTILANHGLTQEAWTEQEAAQAEHNDTLLGEMKQYMSDNAAAITSGMAQSNSAAAQGGDRLASTMHQKMQTAKARTVEVVSQFKSVGRNMVQGLEEGVNSGRSSLVSIVVNTAMAAYRAAQDALEIASPSKLFIRLGKFITQGLGIGVESEKEKPVAAVHNVLTNMCDANIWSTFFEKIINSVGTPQKAFRNHASAANYSNTYTTHQQTFTIGKIADVLKIREEADIDRIANALNRKLQHYNRSRGVS